MNIIKHAVKANMVVGDERTGSLISHIRLAHLADFAAIVRAEALEEVAKVCDDIGDSDNGYGCAAAIRARGEK